MKIKPFNAFRPDNEYVQEIASYPYDVMTRDEYRELDITEKSFLHVIKSDIDFDNRVSEYDDVVYQKAKDKINELINEGIINKDEKECLYIYEEELDGRVQRGIVCACPIEAYLNSTIKRHELTLDTKVEDRKRHIAEIEFQTGSVFLTYQDTFDIDEYIANIIIGNAPEFEFSYLNGATQRLWVIHDEEHIGRIVNMIDDVDSFYIVDGHHRMEAATRLYNEGGDSHMLCTIFPSHQICNLPNHRVIHDVDSDDIDRIISKFDAIKLDKRYIPAKKGCVGIYVNGDWYKLQFHNHEKELDVTLLQNRILSPILGIDNPSTDKRFESVGGVYGVAKVVEKADAGNNIAFIMYPPTVDDMMRIASQGETMPPKSTWFEPKIVSGLFIRKIDNK